MPAIVDVAIFLDASEGLMSEARTHNYIFIDALELILAKLLHSSRSINLCVHLKHFWIRVVVMDATVGFRWTKPHIDFDVVLLNTASSIWYELLRTNFLKIAFFGVLLS